MKIGEGFVHVLHHANIQVKTLIVHAFHHGDMYVGGYPYTGTKSGEAPIREVFRGEARAHCALVWGKVMALSVLIHARIK